MSIPQHHWLVSGNVITSNKGIERQRSLNALLLTEKPAITRLDLAKAQQALQYRFVTQCEQIKGAKISDVFIIGVSLLGTMTPEEFHEGFENDKTEVVDEAQAKLDLQ